MKKRILLAIVMIVGYSVSIMAQTTATGTNNAKCTIIAPISIAAVTELEFGDIIAGDGDVIVSVGNARTIPGALLAGTQLGTVTAATFDIKGEPAYTYAITLPADGDVTISEPGLASMAVKTFNCLSTETSATDGTGKLDGSGDDVVTVGATLDVETSQTQGDYTGTFSVTVAYN